MEEIINNKITAEYDGSSITVCKGYGYTNKDGKQRYSVNDVYYLNGDKTCRKHSNDMGDFFYNIELIDVVVETYKKADGTLGSKTYPLCETPYFENKTAEELQTYLMFKNHR